MKIAFFMPYFRDGGVETTTVRLADEFARDGHETDLVTFKYESPYIDESPLRVIDLESRRTLTSIPKLARYLRRERPDVLISAHHFANISAVIATAVSRTNPHHIVTERLQIDHVLKESENPKDRLLPALMRLTYPMADDIVTVSRDAGDALADVLDVPPERVTAIYNATLVDEVFEQADEEVDHDWFTTFEGDVIVAVGRLTYQKDFQTLLRAFAEVREERDARLLILGEGEDRQSLVGLSSELGIDDDVDLPGFVDNPYKYVKRADLFVLSSRYEGMPNVLVEAAALQTPVVATNCPSGPRELLDDGKGGPLVPVEDALAMADAMLEQLRNPEQARARIESIQQTLEEFRPEQAARNYLDMIEGADG